MALSPRPMSGTKFYVSAAAPATFTEAGYAALTWSEVQGFAEIPGFGESYNIGTFDSVSDGQFKYRGLKTANDFTTTMLDDPTNAGQIIMKAAFDAAPASAEEKISFRRLDAGGYGQAGQGFVSDFTPANGGAGDLQMRNVSIAILVGTIVEIAP